MASRKLWEQQSDLSKLPSGGSLSSLPVDPKLWALQPSICVRRLLEQVPCPAIRAGFETSLASEPVDVATFHMRFGQAQCKSRQD